MQNNKAILTINKLTDRLNGYGMPIVEVNSTKDIFVENIGYNDLQPTQEIDESDLLRLRNYFSSFTNEIIMIEINCPNKKTNAWYKLTDVYIGGKSSNIIF
jgi:hypothetical protein